MRLYTQESASIGTVVTFRDIYGDGVHNYVYKQYERGDDGYRKVAYAHIVAVDFFTENFVQRPIRGKVNFYVHKHGKPHTDIGKVEAEHLVAVHSERGIEGERCCGWL